MTTPTDCLNKWNDFVATARLPGVCVIEVPDVLVPGYTPDPIYEELETLRKRKKELSKEIRAAAREFRVQDQLNDKNIEKDLTLWQDYCFVNIYDSKYNRKSYGWNTKAEIEDFVAMKEASILDANTTELAVQVRYLGFQEATVVAHITYLEAVLNERATAREYAYAANKNEYTRALFSLLAALQEHYPTATVCINVMREQASCSVTKDDDILLTLVDSLI